MRRRLLLTYLSLLFTIMAGLAVPLAATLATQETQTMFIDRQGDTARFASIAEPAIRTGELVALTAELTGYEEIYGISTVVIGRDGVPVAASGSKADLTDDGLERRLRAALAGERSADIEPLWPWQGRPIIVAEPVGRGGEVIGAVATVSPTASLRAATMRSWGVLGIAVLVALAVGLAAARPLTAWMLRPVAELDQVTHDITEGRLGARVRGDAGPPELRRLADSFNTMADTVTELVDRQRTFVSYASHQLRNPLAALRLRVEDLNAHLGERGEADHALALDEVDRLTRICDGLLAVARTGAKPTDRFVADAADIAARRILAWRPVAARSGSSLRQTGDLAAPVLAPAGTLDQALDVLIDNALKFAGPHATVTVDVRRSADGPVHVHVIDDGPGLPETDLESAVRPLWRHDHPGDTGGFGLGLAIVATLLDMADGGLHLAPAEPRGIDARITLPPPQATLPDSLHRTDPDGIESRPRT
ncbi:HAMP domain-containing sensor histidine kinase [Glycomyces sp. YM15]|uniref:sensor histidine kinase n=1 Tax=Glycomyces sp. YM15 TaxID=2800446 RepID=UPI001962663E|nr:HAMP domain-containing sensor histidine kinase [Glycomyces sp. YM15]